MIAFWGSILVHLLSRMGFPKGTLELRRSLYYEVHTWRCYTPALVSPSQSLSAVYTQYFWTGTLVLCAVGGVILNHMGAILKLLPSTYCSTKYLSTLNGNVIALATIFQWTAVTFGAFGKPRPVQRVGRSSVTWSTCGCCCCCYVF